MDHRFLYEEYDFHQEREFKQVREAARTGKLKEICKHSMLEDGICIFCGERI